jgi:hypothetical protein
MQLHEKILVFERLGLFLGQFSAADNQARTSQPWLEKLNGEFYRVMEALITSSHIHNPWFTEENMRFAMETTGESMGAGKIEQWLGRYDIQNDDNPKTVAIVMAGNIPLVGFHDMLCVLISGHNLLAKLSVRDDQLLKLIAEIIYALDNRFEGRIAFSEGRLKDFDAVIATGSNNTSRYFEYYFSKYPHIIRKNRISAAILDGYETSQELQLLSDDVFRYFGLGCRSVSKIFVPKDYEFIPLIEAFKGYKHLADHNQWMNNYEYQKAIHLIDQAPHLDSGFLIIRENGDHVSPIAVLNYEQADSTGSAVEIIKRDKESIQCIVGDPGRLEGVVPFGMAQKPSLADYADNVDTMEFLLNL